MVKRTLYFLNPCSISAKSNQLIITNKDTGEENSVPIEDIGVIILENAQINISNFSLSLLLDNNVSVITCDNTHMPSGLFYTLSSNHIQQEIFSNQINANNRLKNKLWKNTISAKILNQALLLKSLNKKYETLKKLYYDIKTGDTTNRESVAAAYYWKNIFDFDFKRDRFGAPPNNLLNYGYAILRAVTARSLVGSGLLPTIGIHHHNRYNSFCLADDIMEPFRPFVDLLVYNIFNNDNSITELNPEIKKKLLIIPTIEITFDDGVFPLLVGMQRTSSSLAKCFSNNSDSITYPTQYAFKRL